MAREFLYKTKPLKHQEEWLQKTWSLAAWGFHWEPGTGKTKPIIDTAVALYQEGLIDAVLVVAPGGVHINWLTDQLPIHLPDEIVKKSEWFAYRGKRAGTKWHKRALERLLESRYLTWLTISYDSFMTQNAKKYVWRFLRRRRVLFVIDEAHAIAHPSAKRTKTLTNAGKYAPFRRELTGTPTGNSGPFDNYSLIKFLDPNFWRAKGMDKFAAFKSYFGIWETETIWTKGKNGPEQRDIDRLVNYKNEEELTTMMQELSCRILKDDVLDLPPKSYERLAFEMTARQEEIYEKMRRDILVEIEERVVVETELAIVRLNRLQQILSGFVYDNDGEMRRIGEKNPRVETAVGFLHELSSQAIVWCKFKPDINFLMDELGGRAVRYDGAVDEDQRERNRQAFVAGDAQFWIANSQTGGEGLTLLGGTTTLYYSHNPRLITRLQTEDRPHRVGQTKPCTYFDLYCPDTVDENIIAGLRSAYDVAAKINGDRLREWIK